jgi:integrase
MLEEHLAPFVDHLRREQYSAQTVLRALRSARRFLAELPARVRRPEDLRPGHARAFLVRVAQRYRRRHGRALVGPYREILRAALHLFLRYLAARGAAPPLAPPRRQDPCAVPGYEDLLAEYARFLQDHRGLAPGTIDGYLDYAAGLCRARGPVGPWDDLRPARIYEYLLRRARGRADSTVRMAYSALRCFFRFLRLTGRSVRRLESCFVRSRVYPRQAIPPTLSEDEIYRIFAAVRGPEPRPVQHRAVLLLLALYGLRVGEVAHLALDDIRWREGRLTIRRRKNGRDLALPLHPAAARALAEYIQRVRPRGTPFREVFLSQVAPHPYRRGSNLARGVTRELAARGVRLRLHRLRHTLATRLLNHDCPPEWIQILLGHADFDSTRRYARLDLAHLAEVAEIDPVQR